MPVSSTVCELPILFRRTTSLPENPGPASSPNPDPRPGAHRRPHRSLRRSLAAAAAAVTVTGGVVAAGVVATGSEPARSADVAALMSQATRSSAGDTEVLAQMDAQREQSVSRSDRRVSRDTTKRDLLARNTESGGQVTRTEELASKDPKSIARAMLPQFGFGSDQFGCLESLWTKESGWNPQAANPTSSAFGIPQALPGSKMASAGADWATNPATQIKWGLGYIAARYGSPCSAWGHSQSVGWY
jgi:hypothetical protein